MYGIKAVFFDLDDTLFDRCLTIREYAKVLYRDLNLTLEESIFTEEFIHIDNNGYANKVEIYESLKQQFQIDHSSDWFFEHWANTAWEFPHINDNAIELLKRLRSVNIKTGIITNGTTRFQRTKIKNLYIEELLDAVIISEEVGCKKPDRQIFDIAALKVNVLPIECVFVGDNFENDYLGSLNAGMNGILYAKKNKILDPKINSISNLNAIENELRQKANVT